MLDEPLSGVSSNLEIILIRNYYYHENPEESGLTIVKGWGALPPNFSSS